MFIKQIDDQNFRLVKEKTAVGSFCLTPVSVGRKMEKLHVQDTVTPGTILQIFELIQVYVQDKNMGPLHVESHSQTLDLLLQHQGFRLEDVEKRLWIYEGSHAEL
ncbi:hypothetical protein JF544_06990 [Halobacillus kuroshimensis]|uniref:Uncharacterized protein n=1 Tax=Halobacillus kuroshimensis TaxID=302481 RepID=A0ABS3DUH6_9BACI|nr:MULTISPECIES: hypothetical protein [Halobacillus]MBN8234989.1 hypothetical protein [Halobacillus kuroshimensis]